MIEQKISRPGHMKKINIIEIEFECAECGQRIKLAHMKCMVERNNKLMKEIVEDLKEIPFLDRSDPHNILLDKWETRLLENIDPTKRILRNLENKINEIGIKGLEAQRIIKREIKK